MNEQFLRNVYSRVLIVRLYKITITHVFFLILNLCKVLPLFRLELQKNTLAHKKIKNTNCPRVKVLRKGTEGDGANSCKLRYLKFVIRRTTNTYRIVFDWHSTEMRKHIIVSSEK